MSSPHGGPQRRSDAQVTGEAAGFRVTVPEPQSWPVGEPERRV